MSALAGDDEGTGTAPRAGVAVSTTCPYCGVGCGVLATPDGNGGAAIKGDTSHPANYGRLCSKGAALGETIDLGERILTPEIAGKPATWDEALGLVAEKFSETIREHGPDAVAFYVSGQILTEDYYVANKLMKGFIGSGNIDTNSRLCMSSAVAGHKRAFGEDLVPGAYEDLEHAQLLVMVGSNAAWCHPVLYQRIGAVRQEAEKNATERPKIVVIDPRRTQTAAAADLHLPIAPGSDVALFNGLLTYLAFAGKLDRAFIDKHTEGFEKVLTAASLSITEVARICDIDQILVERFYQLFAATERTVTTFSQGVNQSSSGTDKVNAIINVHLATGRIGRRGMGPFSLTGQPNAMGGREVGGLANQLAAHMDFEPASIDRVGRFWQAPAMARRPGLKAVDLFRAIEAGKVRALLIMGTNPAVSMPEGSRVRAALEKCPFLAVADVSRASDTVGYAHVVLPGLGWGEKDGTLTNSERRISRQRAFLPPAGEARPDWWIMTRLAQLMGHGHAFRYTNAAQVFREHAALSGFENDGSRLFDISALVERNYDRLSPIQWPVTAAASAGTKRLFGDGRFINPDRRARFIAVQHRPPGQQPSGAFPLRLNTGRLRDQWHTMTRTGKAPTLAAHRPEPLVEIHPADAARFGIVDGTLARIDSIHGTATLKAKVSGEQRPGEIFVPIHWSDARARNMRVGSIVNAEPDPVSGQPETKHTPVRIAPVATAWWGFLVSEDVLAPDADYAVRVRCAKGWRYELAGAAAPADWPAWALASFGVKAAGEIFDGDAYRAVFLRNGQVAGSVMVASSADRLPGPTYLESMLGQSDVSALALLAGRTSAGRADEGPTVCACFAVPRDRILAAIAGGARSVSAIGGTLKAGTNCGSCIPELQAFLNAAAQPALAEAPAGT